MSAILLATVDHTRLVDQMGEAMDVSMLRLLSTYKEAVRNSDVPDN